MGGSTGLPQELMQFLARDSYSLLIKGAAGTGKTTLALSLLLQSKPGSNFLYVSTRSSPSHLFSCHPWLSERFKAPSRRAASSSPEPRSSEENFVDARLDEPTPLFERITNELMDVGSPLVVVDTWDSLRDFMQKEQILINARVLQSWRERAHAKLVLIGEGPSEDAFDHTVDGVLTLSEEHQEGRILRELTLTKLAGVTLGRTSYYFTLNSGTFQSFDSYHVDDLRISENYIPPQGKQSIVGAQVISTGHRALDKAIGGFPLGSVVALETGPCVSSRVVLLLLAHILANFKDNNCPILIHQLQGLDDLSLSRFLKPIMNSETKLVRILRDNRQYQEGDLADPPAHSTKNGRKAVEEPLAESKKNPNDRKRLNILGADLFEAMLAEAGGKGKLARALAAVRQTDSLTIVVAGDKGKDVLENIPGGTDVRLKVFESRGTIFLQSDVPWSSLFAITFDRKSRSGVGLTPVV